MKVTRELNNLISDVARLQAVQTIIIDAIVHNEEAQKVLAEAYNIINEKMLEIKSQFEISD